MATALKQATIRFPDTYTRNIAEKAAELQGQSLSTFIVSAIREHGENVIRDRIRAIQEFGAVVLSPRDCLPFHRAHGKALHHVLLKEHGKYYRRGNDGCRGSHNSAPVNFGIGYEIVYRQWKGTCLFHAKYLGKHEVVP